MQTRLTYYIGLLVIVILWGCEPSREYDSSSVFTQEQRESAEHIVKTMTPRQLEMLAAITTRGESRDTVLLQSQIACRQLASKLRHEANFTKAIEYARLSYVKSMSMGDTIEILRSLNELGTCFRRIAALTEALDYHYRALTVANAYSDTMDILIKKAQTSALNGVGNIALKMNNLSEAKRCFSESLIKDKELGSALGMAMNYANLGSIMHTEEKYDSALFFYERSYALNEQCGSLTGMGLCHNHFGTLFETRNLLDSARVHYELSYKLLSDSKDKWHWLVSCVSLGRVCLMQGRVAEAELYLLKARDIAKDADATESLEQSHRLLAKLYRQNNDYAKALVEMDESQKLNEAMRKEMQENTFNSVQLEYIKQKGDREVEIERSRVRVEQEQAKLKKNTIVVLSIVSLFFICVAFFAIRTYRNRKELMVQVNADKNKVFGVVSKTMKVPAIEQRNALQFIIDNIDELTIPEARQYLIRAYSSSVSQVDMLSNIISWVHIQMGDVAPKPVNVNFHQLVAEAVDMLSLSSKQKNISFAMPIDRGGLVYADPDMLQCIVLNILSNAIKFSYSGGEVNIKFRDDTFAIMLYVEDHGVGMTKEQLSSVLKPNKRLSNYDFKDSISGLGLNICVELAKKNNGSISVESRQHRGSTFILTMPKAIPNAENV